MVVKGKGSSIRGVSRLAVVLAFLVFQGCAQVPVAYRFDYHAQDREILWPNPEQAVPRFRFGGFLLGEANLVAEKREPAFNAQAFFSALAGIAINRQTVQPINLERPQGIRVLRDGRIAVTDIGRQSLILFDLNTPRVEEWFSAGKGQHLVNPLDIAEVGDEIWVTDSALRRVIRYDPRGTVIDVVHYASIRRPTGIVYAPEQRQVYIADTEGDRVWVLNSSGQVLFSLGQSGEAPGSFNAPTFLAWKDGQLYISDTLNARIQVYDAVSRTYRVIGRRGLYVGDLTRPKGIAVEEDGLIAVAESYYDHIIFYDGEGQVLLPMGGAGTGPGQFLQPGGIATDGHGRIFVSDMLNSRVQILEYLGGQ